jgi:hypothetical protein
MTADGTDGASTIMSAAPGPAAPAPVRPATADVSEFAAATLPGWPVVWAVLAAAAVGIALIAVGAAGHIVVSGVVGVVLVIAAAVVGAGLTAVAPGEARVVQLLGRYTGTIRTQGLQWVSPVTRRQRISTRIRNHETGVAKVNDADGALGRLSADGVVDLDDERRAAMVSNMMVVLCSDQATQPIVNTGTLYS